MRAAGVLDGGNLWVDGRLHDWGGGAHTYPHLPPPCAERPHCRLM